MSRKSELLSIIHKTNGAESEIKAAQLIEEILFLEDRLIELKKLPFLSINPKDATTQKATPAFRQYKELLQQYNNGMNLLLHIVGDDGTDGTADSPYRIWAKSREGMF